MTKCSWRFETPVPKYFRENGFFNNEHMFKFVHWAFSRCWTITHTVFICGRKITLQPYEFIAGRLTSSAECFLSENVFRNQLILLQRGGLIKKSTNSLTNHFTCYIWITERFLDIDNHPNNQQPTNHQPTVNHNKRIKNIRNKKNPPPTPPFLKSSKSEDSVMEDFSSHKKKKLPKVEVYKGIFLTQQDLDECIAIKGSLESVRDTIEFVMTSRGRKKEIYHWPNVMATWNIPKSFAPKIKENEAMGERLCEEFEDYVNFWRCCFHHDRTKDQKGIMFECSNTNKESVFFPFADGEFKHNVGRFIREKKMQKARLPDT